MGAPVAFLEHLLRDPSAWPVDLEAIELAESLGSRQRLDWALEGYLASLRSDMFVPEDAELNPHPLGWLAGRYAELLPHLDAADRPLQGADLGRARQALEETLRAMAEGHQRELYMHHGRAELLVRLGDTVGVDARAVRGGRPPGSR